MRITFVNLLSSCDVQTFRAGGKGGQHQNKTESAVRLVHRPTGISAVCRDERSQHLNKLRSLGILYRKLLRLSAKPKPRIATSISQNQKTKRREKKRFQAQKKSSRKKPQFDE
jgi:protein subunit release factor B